NWRDKRATAVGTVMARSSVDGVKLKWIDALFATRRDLSWMLPIGNVVNASLRRRWRGVDLQRDERIRFRPCFTILRLLIHSVGLSFDASRTSVWLKVLEGTRRKRVSNRRGCQIEEGGEEECGEQVGGGRQCALNRPLHQYDTREERRKRCGLVEGVI